MIPKPKHCDQDWLLMVKVPGGRICGECQKQMTDFTKMSWSKIEQIHTQSDEPVCGMYAQKQLDHWGHEVPSFFSSCSKSAAVLTSIFAALNFQAVEAKPIEISKDVIHFSPMEIARDSVPIIEKDKKAQTIKGIIFDDGTGLPLAKAQVFIENTDIQFITDETGRFDFEFPDSSTIGKKWRIKAEKKKYLSDLKEVYHENEETIVKLFLQPLNGNNKGGLIAFRISPPTKKELRQARWQRFKQKFKNLF